MQRATAYSFQWPYSMQFTKQLLYKILRESIVMYIITWPLLLYAWHCDCCWYTALSNTWSYS